VVGRPRSGKTVKVAIPYLLTWKKAAIIHDVKSSEIWKYTSGFRQQLHQVYRFAPTERNSCKINPLDFIRYGTPKEKNDIDCIVDDIISSTQNIRERGMIKQFLFEIILQKK
jgi:type IV secretion system protein VirD4